MSKFKVTIRAKTKDPEELFNQTKTELYVTASNIYEALNAKEISIAMSDFSAKNKDYCEPIFKVEVKKV